MTASSIYLSLSLSSWVKSTIWTHEIDNGSESRQGKKHEFWYLKSGNFPLRKLFEEEIFHSENFSRKKFSTQRSFQTRFLFHRHDFCSIDTIFVPSTHAEMILITLRMARQDCSDILSEKEDMHLYTFFLCFHPKLVLVIKPAWDHFHSQFESVSSSFFPLTSLQFHRWHWTDLPTMNPSVVPYDWLYGFAALIVVIMMLLCLAPMLGSRPRVLHCPPGQKSTGSTPARNEVPVDMVEMVSLPRAKPMATNKQMVRITFCDFDTFLVHFWYIVRFLAIEETCQWWNPARIFEICNRNHHADFSSNMWSDPEAKFEFSRTEFPETWGNK